MQRKRNLMMILAVLVMVMFSCALLPGLSYADNRYVAQKYSFDAVDIFLVQDGKLAEHWDVMDIYVTEREHR